MTTIRIWKVSCSDMTLGILFYSHLMCSGGVVSVVAMWRNCSRGCLCVVQGAFGFPAGFSLLGLVFLKKLFTFFSIFSLLAIFASFSELPNLWCFFLFLSLNF